MRIYKPFKEVTASHCIDVKRDCGTLVGYHWCIECAARARHGTDMLVHEKEFPRHRIVWFCPEHGFEAYEK